MDEKLNIFSPNESFSNLARQGIWYEYNSPIYEDIYEEDQIICLSCRGLVTGGSYYIRTSIQTNPEHLSLDSPWRMMIHAMGWKEVVVIYDRSKNQNMISISVTDLNGITSNFLIEKKVGVGLNVSINRFIQPEKLIKREEFIISTHGRTLEALGEAKVDMIKQTGAMLSDVQGMISLAEGLTNFGIEHLLVKKNNERS